MTVQYKIFTSICSRFIKRNQNQSTFSWSISFYLINISLGKTFMQEIIRGLSNFWNSVNTSSLYLHSFWFFIYFFKVILWIPSYSLLFSIFEEHLLINYSIKAVASGLMLFWIFSQFLRSFYNLLEHFQWNPRLLTRFLELVMFMFFESGIFKL